MSLSITDPVAVGGADGPGDHPGRRPDHRGGPARRLGAAAADLGAQGAGDRLVPQGAGRAAAVLRAGADRDHATPGPVLGRRRHRRPRRSAPTSARRPRDALARPSSTPATGLEKLAAYPYQIATWVDAAGYPVSVAVAGRRSTPRPGSPAFTAPAGLAVPTDRDVSLTGSHIRPQPGYGYDERRHVRSGARPSLSDGVGHAPRHARPGAGTRPRSRSSSTPSAPSASRARYFDALSAERGTPVKPRLSLRVPGPAGDPAAVPDRDDRPGRARDPDRRPQGSFDLVAALLTVIGRVIRPARAQRRQRRVRHHPGRRRRERHADPVQRRLAGHPVRARVAAADGRARRPSFYVLAGLDRAGAAGDARLDRAARDRRRRVRRQPGLHRAAAQVRLPRAGRDRRRARVRAAHARRRIRRPDPRRAVLGAVRRLDPGRAAGRADPVRQRDPGPARRRPRRQADAARSGSRGAP